MTDEKVKKGYFLLFVPIIGWGLAPNIVDLGLNHVSALPFLTYRFLAATLLISPFVLFTRMQQIKVLLKNKWTWLIGLSQTWAIVFQYLSQIYILPALSAIIAYSYMILVPIVSVPVLKEKLDRQHIPVVILATIGLSLIATEGSVDVFNTSSLGIFLAFLSTWGFAFYITTTSRLMRKSDLEVDSLALFYLIMIIVSIAGLLLSVVFDADLQVTSSASWFYIILLALVSTVFAYIAYIESLKYISPNTASVLLLLQIVIPFLIDFFWFGRIYNLWILSGSIFIIVASYLAVRTHEH